MAKEYPAFAPIQVAIHPWSIGIRTSDSPIAKYMSQRIESYHPLVLAIQLFVYIARRMYGVELFETISAANTRLQQFSGHSALLVAWSCTFFAQNLPPHSDEVAVWAFAMLQLSNSIAVIFPELLLAVDSTPAEITSAIDSYLDRDGFIPRVYSIFKVDQQIVGHLAPIFGANLMAEPTPGLYLVSDTSKDWVLLLEDGSKIIRLVAKSLFSRLASDGLLANQNFALEGPSGHPSYKFSVRDPEKSQWWERYVMEQLPPLSSSVLALLDRISRGEDIFEGLF
jgi:hypothetical protein